MDFDKPMNRLVFPIDEELSSSRHGVVSSFFAANPLIRDGDFSAYQSISANRLV